MAGKTEETRQTSNREEDPFVVIDDSELKGGVSNEENEKDDNECNFHQHKNNFRRYSEKEWWGCRHTLVLMCFLGITVCYTTRVCFSVAIVKMVGSRGSNRTFLLDNTNKTQDVCTPPDDTYEFSDIKPYVQGEFDWDEQIQGFALGAFYWGNTVSNIPVGRAAECYGGRLVFGLCVVLSSFFCILAPFCAWISKELFIIIRVLAGLCQGGIFPTISTLLVSWVTPEDRSKFSSVTYSGVQVGTVAAMSVSGLLCDSGVIGGWPLPFFVFGSIGCLWGIPWFILIRDTHKDQPRVSQAEMDYFNKNKGSVKNKKVVSIPWKHMLSSKIFWAIFLAYGSTSYGLYMFLNGIPTYQANVLYFDLKQNGLLSALPYICMLFVSLGWGAIMNWLTKTNRLSIKSVRKLSTAAGGYVTSAALVLLCFAICDSATAITILCVGVSFFSPNFCGYMASPQDIAPNLAGTVHGFANAMGALHGFMAPAVTGAITHNNQTLTAWRWVFIITAIYISIPVTFYVFCITDEVQYWNDLEMKKKHEDKREDSAP